MFFRLWRKGDPTESIPLSAEASCAKTIVFNTTEILNLFKRYANVVKVVFSGHSHDGGYHFDEKLNIAFITVQAPLVFGDSFGVVTVLDDKIVIKGVGALVSREIRVS